MALTDSEGRILNPPEYMKSADWYWERLKDTQKIMESLPENADRAQVQATLTLCEGLAVVASIMVETNTQLQQVAYQLDVANNPAAAQKPPKAGNTREVHNVRVTREE